MFLSTGNPSTVYGLHWGCCNLPFGHFPNIFCFIFPTICFISPSKLLHLPKKIGGGSHFTFWAFPQQILLHFPNSFLHFPIKIASFTQKNAAFPQQFAAFPQQIASFPQQFGAFPHAILCRFAKKNYQIFSIFSHIWG